MHLSMSASMSISMSIILHACMHVHVRKKVDASMTEGFPTVVPYASIFKHFS